MRRIPLLPRTTIFAKFLGIAVISRRTFSLWLFALQFAGLPCPSDFLVAPLHNNISCFEMKGLFHNLTIYNMILNKIALADMFWKNGILIFISKILKELYVKSKKTALVLLVRKAFVRKNEGTKFL